MPDPPAEIQCGFQRYSASEAQSQTEDGKILDRARDPETPGEEPSVTLRSLGPEPPLGFIDALELGSSFQERRASYHKANSTRFQSPSLS